MGRFVALVLALPLFSCPTPSRHPAVEGPEGSRGGSPEARVRRILSRSPSEAPSFVGSMRPSAAPQRIVSLAPSLTELLFALGAGDRVVGASRFADFPEEVRRLPKVGSYTDLEVEALLALRPDLVVCIPGRGYLEKLALIAEAGVPVLIVPGSSIADLFVTLRTVGEVLHVSPDAQALAERISRGLLRVASTARPAASPRVALVYGWRPLFLAGPNSFPDELLEIIGAQNAVSRGGAWARWSHEGLLATGAEVLVDATTAGTEMPPSLSQLPAVRDGRVVEAPHPSLLRPGPRLAQAAEALAAVVFGPVVERNSAQGAHLGVEPPTPGGAPGREDPVPRDTPIPFADGLP